MKKKLIEFQSKNSLECDNPKCDYVLPYDPTVEENLDLFINTPCPRCQENLLTIGDYLRFTKLMKRVNWINKWFSWLTIFSSKKPKEFSTVLVNTHKKYTVTVKEDKPASAGEEFQEKSE